MSEHNPQDLSRLIRQAGNLGAPDDRPSQRVNSGMKRLKGGKNGKARERSSILELFIGRRQLMLVIAIMVGLTMAQSYYNSQLIKSFCLPLDVPNSTHRGD